MRQWRYTFDTARLCLTPTVFLPGWQAGRQASHQPAAQETAEACPPRSCGYLRLRGATRCEISLWPFPPAPPRPIRSQTWISSGLVKERHVNTKHSHCPTPWFSTSLQGSFKPFTSELTKFQDLFYFLIVFFQIQKVNLTVYSHICL